jgi:sulfite reductase (NADPH) hemoprotein beta-component
MAKSRTPLPAILIANDFLDGEVVFLGPAGWEQDHRRAQVARTEDEAAALVARAAVGFAANEVVDPYLAEVAVEADGTPRPLHYRELMRTLGPTTRPDLGKQARAG